MQVDEQMRDDSIRFIMNQDVVKGFGRVVARSASSLIKEHPHLTTRQLVPIVYADVAEELHTWAERSLQAHLIKLEADLATTLETGRWKLIS